MDSIASDPELGQELLQLLYRKLQRQRQELHDLRSTSAPADDASLRSENESLRSELAALEFHLLAESDKQDSKDALRLNSAKAAAQEEALEECQQGQAEDETLQELREKIAKYKDKYHSYKAANETLEKDLLKATDTLQSATDKLNVLQQGIARAESELEAIKQGSSNFDWTHFLQNDGIVKSRFPQLKDMEPFLSSVAFHTLPQDMPKKYRSLNVLILRSNEALWSSSGIDRVLQFLPSFLYKPTALHGDGGWIHNADVQRFHSKQGEKWEIICQHQNRWYYYGTYQCVRNSLIAIGEAQSMCPKMAGICLNQVVADKAQIPPIVHRFISATLSGQGPFTFDCFGFERIGYDYTLYDALLSRKKQLQQTSAKPKNHSLGQSSNKAKAGKKMKGKKGKGKAQKIKKN